MDNKTFLIDYGVYFKDGSYEARSPMKVKNCYGVAHAKVKLEAFLKQKNNNFKEMVVYSCKEDNGSVNDLFKDFPFNFK